MKITKIDMFVLDTKQKNVVGAKYAPVGCRIYTDAGIYGDGESATAFFDGAWPTIGMMEVFARCIIGMDPLENEVIWEKMYKSSFWGQNGGPIVFAGMSALDIALWDIKGKFFQQPLYKLLGGKQREKLRCYASQIQMDWPEIGSTDQPVWLYKPEDFAAAAKKAVDDGYDAVKVDCFMVGDQGQQLRWQDHIGILPPKTMKMIEARLAAVRKAVGDNVDIIIENHSFPDANAAVQIMQMAEPYKILFFEEPNTPSPQTSRYIKANTNIPIANGERVFSRWQYVPYFQDGTIQVAQPDIGDCGGLTETKKICDMAHAYDVMVQAHVCCTQLSTELSLHLETAIPNFIIHETHVNDRWSSNLHFTTTVRHPKDGFIAVSEEPGIGTEWTQEAIDGALARRTVELEK